MPQSDHPAHHARPHGPKRRSDSTRPTHNRADTRRGGARRPYPTASTTTRVSPAKSSTTTARSRSSAAGTAQPTPATVWPAGPAPIDLDTSWPAPIIGKIVTSFSEPGARVVLLPWPTPQSAPGERHGLGIVSADGVIEHAPGTAPDSEHDCELGEALAAVESLGRSGHVVRVAAEENLPGPVSRPFWADLVGDHGHSPAPTSCAPRSGLDVRRFDTPDALAPNTDLLIASLRPGDGGDLASDLVALVAARLLRVGGILVVLTHCDWRLGELTDPTGAVVASAQNADLLYLQHIIALHVPVRDGRLATESLTDPDRAITSAATEEHARTEHRAAVRGLPAPHRRVHSDVLAFGQPQRPAHHY